MPITSVIVSFSRSDDFNLRAFIRQIYSNGFVRPAVVDCDSSIGLSGLETDEVGPVEFVNVLLNWEPRRVTSVAIIVIHRQFVAQPYRRDTIIRLKLKEFVILLSTIGLYFLAPHINMVMAASKILCLCYVRS